MHNRQISVDAFIGAARTGDVNTINNYISQHRESGDLTAAVNVADQFGYTALIWAAYYGHTAIVQALLQVPGIAVNAADQSGSTVLIWAAANGHTAAVQALLAIPGINVNAANQFGDTALICAAANGHIATVTALLQVPGIDLDAQNNAHMTAAGEAERSINNRPAYREIYDLITTAIRARRAPGAAVAAAPAAIVSISVANAQQAARVGDLATVQGYIRANSGIRAAMNAADTHGDTILIIAAMYGRTAIVNELIRVPEIDITATNTDHRTAAAEAQYNGYVEIATQLTTLIALHEHDQMSVTETLAAESLSTSSPVSPKAAPTFEDRLVAINFDESQISPEFIDPISRSIINDPLACDSGYTYDKKTLIAYFASKRNPQQLHCPATRYYIQKAQLNANTNVIIRSLIEKFVSKQEMKYKQRQAQENNVVAAAISSSSTTSENPISQENKIDIEKIRAARLIKLTLFNATSSSTSQANGQNDNDAMAVDPAPQRAP